jgi:hypothetical protein
MHTLHEFREVAVQTIEHGVVPRKEDVLRRT